MGHPVVSKLRKLKQALGQHTEEVGGAEELLATVSDEEEATDVHLLVVVDEVVAEDVPALRGAGAVEPKAALDDAVCVQVLGHLPGGCQHRQEEQQVPQENGAHHRQEGEGEGAEVAHAELSDSKLLSLKP
uniref:Uncharacterized protein n=1 Tax=Steinernema glaseri TaxID=37863 RepID=A0A1I7Z0X3_9BILA